MKKIMIYIGLFCAGGITPSLWITNSDTWKYLLPIALFCILMNQVLQMKK